MGGDAPGPPVEAVCPGHTTYRQKTKEKKAEDRIFPGAFVRSPIGMSGWWYGQQYSHSQEANTVVQADTSVDLPPFSATVHTGNGIRS